MPLLRNPDKSKLSKRKNPTSINYYRDMGYLPEAVINYLGMMGWTMPDGRELFTIEEMTEKFDLMRVSLGGPVFDVEKLDWLNGKYIRERLSDTQFIQLFAQWAFDEQKMAQIVPLLKDRVERFSDVVPLAGFFLSGLPEINADSFVHKQLSEEQMRKILQFTLWQLENGTDLSRDAVEHACVRLAAYCGFKIRDFLYPLFVAITGKAVSTSVIDAISIIGIDVSRARIRAAIGVLGGISKKETKTLEKEFRDFAQSAE